MQTETPQLNSPLDPQLDYLINNHPSIIRNSTVSFLIKIVTYLLGALLLAGGIGLLISAYFQEEVMKIILSEDLTFLEPLQVNQLEQFNFVFGITIIFAGLLLLLIARLARMILKRNGYILQLLLRREELIQQAEEKLKEETT